MAGDLILEPLLVPSGITPQPTVAAGAGAGTSPPAPTLTGGSNAWRGTVSMGTGTVPAAGILAAVTFPAGLFPTGSVIMVIAVPVNAATAALVTMIDAITTSGFNIVTENAPAASQTVGTYQVSYIIFVQ